MRPLVAFGGAKRTIIQLTAFIQNLDFSPRFTRQNRGCIIQHPQNNPSSKRYGPLTKFSVSAKKTPIALAFGHIFLFYACLAPGGVWALRKNSGFCIFHGASFDLIIDRPIWRAPNREASNLLLSRPGSLFLSG